MFQGHVRLWRWRDHRKPTEDDGPLSSVCVSPGRGQWAIPREVSLARIVIGKPGWWWPRELGWLRINRTESSQSGDLFLAAAASQIPELAQDERAVGKESLAPWIKSQCHLIVKSACLHSHTELELKCGHPVNDDARTGSKTNVGCACVCKWGCWLKKEDSLATWRKFIGYSTKHIHGINYCNLGNDFKKKTPDTQYIEEPAKNLPIRVTINHDRNNDWSRKERNQDLQTCLISTAVAWGKLKHKKPKRDL